MEFIEERGTNKHQKKVSLYKCKCGNEFEAIKLPQNFRHYKISYRDKEYSLKELCNELNLKYGTVYKRIKKYGWSLEKALDCKACEWLLEHKDNQ